MDPEPLSLFISLITYTEISSLVFLLILLLCSALISGAEVAFFSLTATDFESADEKNPNKKLAIVERLLARPKKLLATILVANNLINIAIVLLFASLSDVFFGNLNAAYFGINIRFILEVVLVTFLILLFGEILPKIYASRNKQSFSLLMAYPLNVLDKFFSPISLPMRAATLYIEDKFGKQKSNLSVDQLSQALELTDARDTTKEEQKILRQVPNLLLIAMISPQL